MLNSDIGIMILNGLFATSRNNDVRLTFTGDIYLGLLTRLPKNDKSAYEDEFYFSEPSDPEYIRIKLNTNSRINKAPFISGAEAGEQIEIDGCQAIPAYITNQSLIMFPESTVDWDNIIGFGLFRSNNTSSKELPFLWGNITSDDGASSVEIKQHEVPIVRSGSFKVSLV